MTLKIPYGCRRVLVDHDVREWWVRWGVFRLVSGRCFVTISLHREYRPIERIRSHHAATP